MTRPNAEAPLRWAILGTANIARAQLLPALREAGSYPSVVAGRDGARASAWAAEHGVAAAVEGYAAALTDPDVDAVYVALPNSLHAEWTTAAIEAGKAVLCEKPLCADVSDTERVVTTARSHDALLWEAFVFPLGPQFEHVRNLVDGGAIGELREIASSFHFRVRRADDIRLSSALGGGCVADVGSYPIRLAQLLFGASPLNAAVRARRGREVETDVGAILEYPGGRRLALTCGFARAYDTGTRLLGTEGTITITNPFHPGRDDTVTVSNADGTSTVHAMTDDHSFTGAVRHVTAVVRGRAAPQHLAAHDSLETARTIAMVQQLA